MDAINQALFERVEEKYLMKALNQSQSHNVADRLEAEYIRDVFLPMLRINMKYIDKVRTSSSNEEGNHILSSLYSNFVLYISLNISMMVPPKHFQATCGEMLKQIQDTLVNIYADIEK